MRNKLLLSSFLLTSFVSLIGQTDFKIEAGTNLVIKNSTILSLSDIDLTNLGTLEDDGGTVVINDTVNLSGAGTNNFNHLTINADALLNVNPSVALTVNGNIVNNGELNLLANISGNSTLVNTGTITGTGSAKVQQYLAGSNRNYYVGAPVSNATGVVFDNGNENKFYHNAEEQRYYTLADGANLNAVQGYVYRSADAQTVEFSGALNTGAFSNNSLPRVGVINASRGYNLVANPYPSFIDWKAVTKTNLEPSMWYRTHNGDNNVFDTYNATSEIGTNNNGAGSVTEFIPPMQGFWVRVDADGNTGQISLDNTMRSHQTGVLRAPKQQDIFRFTVNKDNQSDEAVINFTPNAEEDIEAYDSRKMYSNTQAQVAMVVNGDDLVINSLPSYYNASVPAKVTFTEAGLYTLKSKQQSGDLQGVQVVLEDLLTQQKVSFNAGESYSFKGNKEDANRFVIHFGDIPLSTLNVSATAPIIFANNNQITIKVAEVNNVQATIYSISGQVVQTQNINNTLTQINTNLSKGVYIVELNNGGELTREKVIIQ